jgi:hypothetical protein
MPEDDNVRTMWSDDELDRALAALHPAPDTDDRAFHRVKAGLLLAGDPVVSTPAPKRRRWAWWTASVATVLTVAASVLLVQTVQTGSTMPDAAGDQLSEAAAKAGTADEPLAPGQYRYITTHAWWLSVSGDYAYLAENLMETWVPADERQDWLWRRDVTGARKWVAGTEAAARADGVLVDEADWPEGEWRAPCGDWYATEPCTTPGSWQTPDAGFLAALPRDTEALYTRLRTDTAGHGTDPDLEVVVYVADTLRTGRVPADLRAALYRVLAKVPGLEITEQVANLDGVRGTAYGLSADGTRHDVIVDPRTGEFIGERRITEDGFGTIPAGTVTEYTSVTTSVAPAIGVR